MALAEGLLSLLPYPDGGNFFADRHAPDVALGIELLNREVLPIVPKFGWSNKRNFIDFSISLSIHSCNIHADRNRILLAWESSDDTLCQLKTNLQSLNFILQVGQAFFDGILSGRHIRNDFINGILCLQRFFVQFGKLHQIALALNITACV